MRANELMIGDWISYNGKMPARVLSFNGQTIKFDNGTPQDWLSSIENFEPIPLTAEILKKNGFVKGDEISDTPPFDRDEEGNMYYSYKGEHKFWGWWQPNNIYFIPANAMGNLNIEFVHELQHALRLCGIDKEIEL